MFSCLFQIVIASLMLMFAMGVPFSMRDHHLVAAVIQGALALLCFIVILIVRRARKRTPKPSRKAQPNRVPKYIGDALIAAHADLQHRGFKCHQCRTGYPISEAGGIDIEHFEDEVETRDGDFKTKTFHRYRGLICKRCAKVVARIPSDEHTYLAIPDELRKCDTE